MVSFLRIFTLTLNVDNSTLFWLTNTFPLNCDELMSSKIAQDEIKQIKKT